MKTKICKIKFDGLKLVSNTKLKLSQELVEVLLGKKIAVEIYNFFKSTRRNEKNEYH